VSSVGELRELITREWRRCGASVANMEHGSSWRRCTPEGARRGGSDVRRAVRGGWWAMTTRIGPGSRLWAWADADTTSFFNAPLHSKTHNYPLNSPPLPKVVVRAQKRANFGPEVTQLRSMFWSGNGALSRIPKFKFFGFGEIQEQNIVNFKPEFACLE